MGTKKKSVPKNKTKPQKIVTNRINPLVANSSRDSIWFDLHSSKWLSSVKTKKFTNFLRDSDEFNKNHFFVSFTLIPKVIAEWKAILSGGRAYGHCHLLNGDNRTIAEDVYEKIYNHKLDEGLGLRQLGFTGSVRLICIHNDTNNCLIPIFIDHHHLIYASDHYNDKDYEKYNYCPVCSMK